MLVPQKSNQLFNLKDRKSLTDLENFISDHVYRSSQTIAPMTFSSRSPSKKTILLIDDDPDMIEIGRKIIVSAGYNFISASNGQEGLDFILKYKPDLILLDYMMPVMNGVEVFNRLVTSQRYKHLADTPVIMITAQTEYDIDRTALFEMGLAAFLIKPFGHRELMNVIDNVFILHQVRQKNKELEQKIRRTEYKYQDLIENANDLIYTLNLKGDFIFINRRLSTLAGFAREDWIGRSFFDLVAPEDRVEARNNFNMTIQGKARIFEIRMICQTGAPLYLSMNINPIFEKGEVVGVVGIARDITQRKKLEQEITELKNFNESIIQSMGAGLITLDLERRITSFNNGAEEVLGYKSDEVIGKYIDEILPIEESRKLLPDVISHEHSLLNREMELTRKDGKKVFVGYTVTPRIDNHNLKVGTIISFRDISQIKQMQIEVVRMDRLASLGVLASGIAHEVRNPLAGIKTMAQILEEELDKTDSRQEYLARIIKQVNRLDNLLRALFSYAKPREPQRKTYQLNEIIKEAEILLQDRFKNANLTYQKKFDPNLVPVFVDFNQIQQVFINLYMNAIDAMPQGGLLEVTARTVETVIYARDRRKRSFIQANKPGRYVEVAVRDTGIGIKPDQLNIIFDPFFTTKPQGTGLGLSIVYRIIEEHGGDIRVDSKVGEGTTFTLLLPTEE
ncbi:MAG: PAS domain S-box protein [candidate division KSB1 bacterium]|nr:PAS domain S-box protein [candidate division KSB1 bacterium]MDZ7336592.1 PAS domain S-box protein [candidate division KSB1 bacterium]MDZ7401343.1 PAS domain S-box protein [candidate division KSB1 bacterium]